MHSSISTDIFKYPLKIFKIYGAWPIEKIGRAKWFLSIPTYILLTTFCTLLLIQLPKSSYEEAIEALMSFIVLIFYLFQIILLRINHKKLASLLKTMNIIENTYLRDTDLDILSKKLNTSKLLYKVLGTAYIMAMTFLFLTAFLDSNYVLVFPSHFPYDYTDPARPVIYYCTILYQYFICIYAVVVCSVLNSYGPMLYSVLTTYLRILGLQINDIGWQKPLDQKNAIANEHKISKCAQFYAECIR